MKSNVLIVVAPFGFGPAAKALIIGAALADIAQVTFSADVDAAEFIERHKLPGTTCVKGRFSRAFADHQSLKNFDLVISVSHDPAIHHLGRLGLAGRGVFLDSLLTWRANSSTVDMPQGLSAYLVEDYLGAGAELARCKAGMVALTAPLIWPLAGEIPQGLREGITLHLGGVTSPIATWESLAPTVFHIARQVIELARSCGQNLTIMGSARLRELPLAAENVRVLGDVSPAESARLIASSRLVVSTPGIGAVYEAIIYGTPIVLLAAMNSTQLHQYRWLTQSGIQGTVHPDLMTRLYAVAAKAGWDQQTHLCLRVLQDFPGLILSQLSAICAPLIAPDAEPQAREGHLNGQRKLVATLSTTDPIHILRTLAGA